MNTFRARGTTKLLNGAPLEAISLVQDAWSILEQVSASNTCDRVCLT